MTTNNIACRLCGSKELTRIHQESFPRLNYESDDHELEPMVLSYYACCRCGTIRVYPDPPDQELAYYYTQVPSVQVDPAFIKNYKGERYSDRIQLLQSVSGGLRGRVFEIGAAAGAFLSMLRDTAGVHVLGIEPSQECRRIAARDYGVEILPGTLETVSLDSNGLTEAFDLTLSMNTLEHVANARCFVEKMARTVKPGGHLFIEVPSTEYLGRYRSVASGQDVNPGHLSHFSASALASLIEDLGMTVAHLAHNTKFDSPSLQIVCVKSSAPEVTRFSFLEHIAARAAWLRARARWLKNLTTSHDRVVLWGAGSDLWNLMAHCNDLGFIGRCVLVDRNPVKQGKTMMGLAICSPKILKASAQEVVVITPANRGLQLLIRRDIEGHLPAIESHYLFPVDG